MTLKSTLALAVLATTVVLSTAPARAAAPVCARPRYSRHRIAYGVRTGALTPRQARRLRQRQYRIAQRSWRARYTRNRNRRIYWRARHRRYRRYYRYPRYYRYQRYYRHPRYYRYF